MYEAVLFDMDGVLIDSMPYHLIAFNECLAGYGYSVNSEQIAGRSTIEILSSLFQDEMSDIEIKRIATIKSTRSLEIMNDNKDNLLIDGAVEVLKMAKQSRLLALCTSASPASVDFVLGELLKEDLFNTVVHSGVVQFAKPHPEVYETAMASLQVRPTQCLVVEDSTSGVESGIAAGCDVAFLISDTRQADIYSECVTVIKSLWDLQNFLSLDEKR